MRNWSDDVKDKQAVIQRLEGELRDARKAHAGTVMNSVFCSFENRLLWCALSEML